MLPTNEDWSFVCCLSSINVLHYEKWKDTDAVETMIYFLDAVISEFVEKLEVYKNPLILMTNKHFCLWKEHINLHPNIERWDLEFLGALIASIKNAFI